MKQLRVVARHRLCIVSSAFLLCGTVLCLLSAAMVFFYYFSETGDTALWIRLHFREAISVVLFSVDLTCGIGLLLDAEYCKREKEKHGK